MQSGLIRNKYIIVHIANRGEILAAVENITKRIDDNNNQVPKQTKTKNKDIKDQ